MGNLSVNADIINLNQYRKARLKADKQEKAAENRAKHGRSKAQKQSEKKQLEITEKEISGKKITEDDCDTPV